MKTPALKKLIFIATVLAALGAAILPQNSRAQTQSAPTDDTDQPATPAALPPDISPASPLAEVIKLTQAGVSQKIILAYISNSSGTFNLDTDKIIYLTNLGTPDEIVTAMMQHDQSSPQQTSDAGTQSVSPPPDASVETTEVAAQPPDDDTQVDFDDTLAPYGSWVVVEGYGRCWRPTVTFYDTGWQPYCDHGHWVYTDSGWYWLSDYSWGATFHYGRWFRDARIGWCWWPDTVWAPSWVAWRYSDDYCGWAPLPPHTVYREGVGIFYNGVAVGADFDFGLSVNFFTFVPTRNFCDPHPHNFRVAPAEVAQIYNRTTVINNFGVNSHDRTFVNNGIPPERISAVTHTEIRRVNIRDSSAPVPHGEQLDLDTLIVNRPHFNDHPNPAVTHAAISTSGQNAPRETFVRENGTTAAPRNPTPPQNNFSQPDYNRPAPQTQPSQSAQPETPRAPVQHQTPAPNPASGTPHTFEHNPEAPQNINTPPQNQIGAPAVNHYAPAPSQPSQHDFAPRQNDSSPDVPRQNRTEPPAMTIQPQTPPGQYQPAQPATTTPGQKNSGSSGRWDKNQNGQQQ
jgi:hypothetical protein